MLNKVNAFLDFISISSSIVTLAWKAQPSYFIAITLLNVLQGFLPLANAWVTKSLFDLITISTQTNTYSNLPRDLILLLVGYVFLSIMNYLSIPINKYLNSELTRNLTLTTQSDLYNKINGFMGLEYFENPGFYDKIRLAGHGAQYGPTLVIQTLTSLTQSVTTLISFFGVLLSFSPFLAGIVVFTVLPQLYVQLKVSKQRFGLAYTNSPKERLKAYYERLMTDVSSVKDIRLFNLGDYFQEKFVQIYKDIHETQRKQELNELYPQTFLNIFATVVTGGALIAVIIQAFLGRLSVGDVILYLSAVGSVQGSLSNIIFNISNFSEAALFYNQYEELLMLPQPVFLAHQSRSIPKLKNAIEFRNVSFRYNEHSPWVIKDINLLIPANKCLALVGPNGAGKTTLVKLLTRFYDPTEGQILWDGIDIREFELGALRERTGALFQDFVRYEMTAQENIGFGNLSHLNDAFRVSRAAMDVGIHHSIEALPQKYQTILSKQLSSNGQGTDFSGGQWQKLALARVFMRDTELIILDEPTSSLDAQSEYEIFCRFRDLASQRTSLLISHRFSTVKMADFVAVIEESRLTEYGSHDSLLSLQGTYARLFSMQAKQYSNQQDSK